METQEQRDARIEHALGVAHRSMVSWRCATMLDMDEATLVMLGVNLHRFLAELGEEDLARAVVLLLAADAQREARTMHIEANRASGTRALAAFMRRSAKGTAHG